MLPGAVGGRRPRSSRAASQAERYQFLGFLPRGGGALAALWDELARWPHAAVAFESPRRLPRVARVARGALPERPVAVCRELTKRFEEVVRGHAAEVAQRFAEAAEGRDRASCSARAEVRADDGGEAVEAVRVARRRRRAAAPRRGGRRPA